MRINQKKLTEFWSLANTNQIMWTNVVMYLFGVWTVIGAQTEAERDELEDVLFIYEIARHHADTQIISMFGGLDMRVQGATVGGNVKH